MSDYEDKVDGLNLKVVGTMGWTTTLNNATYPDSFEKQGLKFALGVTLVKLS